MREFKFRAWDMHRNEYIYDFHLSKIMHGTFEFFPFEWPDKKARAALSKHQDPTGHYGLVDFSNYRFEDIIIEQFTGMYDCNEKEIYEGDILKDHFVDIIDGTLRLEESLVVQMPEIYYINEHLSLRTEQWCEIIGNIHETV